MRKTLASHRCRFKSNGGTVFGHNEEITRFSGPMVMSESTSYSKTCAQISAQTTNVSRTFLEKQPAAVEFDLTVFADRSVHI